MKLLFILAYIQLAFIQPKATNNESGTSNNSYYVADFGAVGDGTTNDFKAIQNAVSALVNDPSPASLYFERGKTYKCVGSGRLFEIRQTSNKTIYGNDAEIIVQPSILGITIDQCDNILVKDLVFDSDPLSWTQGKITAVDINNKQFTVEIEAGYPVPDNHTEPYATHSWGMLWEATGYDIKNELIYIDQCQRLGGNTVKFTVRNDMQTALENMAINDRFTRDVYAVGGTFNHISQSKNITFENLTVYATRALVNVINDNTGRVRMNGINMRRKPNTTRLLSGYRDGFHCKRNKVGPIIENCYIEGLCDDAINLSGGYYYIAENISPTQFKLDDISGFEVGDRLSFVDMKKGIELGETLITALSATKTVTTADPISGTVAGEPRAKTTTFVTNLSKSNSNFIIRNNTFAGQRRFAMLIRCQNGLIENNTGTKLQAGIVLSNEINSFFEGPFPANITIRNNTFTETRRWPIYTGAKTYASRPSQLIHNIKLIDNHFGTSVGHNTSPLVTPVFEDVKGLEMEGNTFAKMEGINHAMEFDNCREVTFLCGNKFNNHSILSVADGANLKNTTTEADITFNCITSATQDTYKSINYKFFPNPSNGILNIRTTLSNYTITIVDINGKTIKSIQNSPSSVDLSALRNGMYWISISDGKSRVGEMVIKR